MGQVIPRPAIRARENRRIVAALAEAHRRSSFEVINLENLSSHGLYDTLDEARGCVEFDRLFQFQIWQGDRLVVNAEAN